MRKKYAIPFDPTSFGAKFTHSYLHRLGFSLPLAAQNYCKIFWAKRMDFAAALLLRHGDFMSAALGPFVDLFGVGRNLTSSKDVFVAGYFSFLERARKCIYFSTVVAVTIPVDEFDGSPCHRIYE
jgi:hypothetical protein